MAIKIQWNIYMAIYDAYMGVCVCVKPERASQQMAMAKSSFN